MKSEPAANNHGCHTVLKQKPFKLEREIVVCHRQFYHNFSMKESLAFISKEGKNP